MNNELNIYWLGFHIFQVCVFQFYAAAKMSHLAYFLMKRRNLDISSQYLPTNQMLHPRIIDISIGVICIALLGYGYLYDQQSIYKAGKYISVFGFLFTTVGIDLIRCSLLKKKIPLAQKRTASLEARGLGRIVPLWSWGLYVVAVIIAVYFTEPVKTQYSLAIGSLILLITAQYIEKRAKLPINSLDDEIYRKSEAWTVCLVAWSFPIVIPMRNHFTVYGIDAFFSTLPMICFIVFLNSNIYKKITTV